MQKLLLYNVYEREESGKFNKRKNAGYTKLDNKIDNAKYNKRYKEIEMRSGKKEIYF